MNSLAGPGSPTIKALTEAWRSEPVQALLEQFGRALRLDLPLFFDFDKDYGFRGALEARKQDPLNSWFYRPPRLHYCLLV